MELVCVEENVAINDFFYFSPVYREGNWGRDHSHWSRRGHCGCPAEEAEDSE